MGETGKFYSWEIIDNITAIKNCDKSFFEHNCSGVPTEIRWFFDSKDIKNGNKIVGVLNDGSKFYTNGIEIEFNGRSATYLPEVALEQNWD